MFFDLIEPLRQSGVEALRARLDAWFSSFEGPIRFEMAKLDISAGQTVAFASHLSHVEGTNKAGVDIDMWWRSTLCFRCINGGWRVSHEHSSVPFDMTDGLALLDLKP